MGKELAKIKGTRVMEITRMGGSGTGMQAQPGDDTPPPTAGQVAGQTASDSASNHFGLAGQAIGGLMGGIRAQEKARPAASRHTRHPNHDRSHADGDDHPDAQLLWRTSLVVCLDIPAGYKQVESAEEQMLNKK